MVKMNLQAREDGSYFLILILICLAIASLCDPPEYRCTAISYQAHDYHDQSKISKAVVHNDELADQLQLDVYEETHLMGDLVNPIHLKGSNDGAALDSSDSTKLKHHEHHGGPWLKASVVYDVRNAGAVGDGVTNDTKAFLAAWADACAVSNGEVHAPSGYTFLVYPSTYEGPCQRNTTFKVDGTIVAPAEVSAWDGLNHRLWLNFQDLDYLYIQGSGTFNGRGQNWWACRENGTCSEAPTAVTVYRSSNVSVNGVKLLNSQQIHINFNRVTVGQAKNITIEAPASSPNTDGIHISGTTNFTIQDCQVSTGDDCVSIVTGSHNIAVQNTYCGKGCHGISVGSLGANGAHDNVTQVLVKNCTLENTTNGLRIKTWQGGSGIAQNIVYQNIQMTNVSNPIIIDQYYCPESQVTDPCENSTSAVKVNLVKYINITGTSASSRAVYFHCSSPEPCTGLYLKNVNLVRTSGSATSSSCTNANGSATGTEHPPSCLGAHSDSDLRRRWWLWLICRMSFVY